MNIYTHEILTTIPTVLLIDDTGKSHKSKQYLFMSFDSTVIAHVIRD